MNQSYFYLKMKEHKLKVPYTGKERRVRILLPKDYEKDTDRSYPVVYFHDGQNVFNSKESFIGHSWKIIPAIKRNPDISRMIVVAIDNDGMGRMNEYAAWKFQESPIPEQQFGGKGVEYAEFVMEVVKPFIKHKTGWFDGMMTTGCSMGAYHALNFFLQHPDVFTKVIALSGVYDARFFVGDYYNDDAIYQNSPVDYIWNQNDGWFIDRYRQSEIVLCTGLGAWEQDGLPSFYKLKEAFDQKQIPAWFAEWGHDVAHDWEWWRKQMPYFLGNLYL